MQKNETFQQIHHLQDEVERLKTALGILLPATTVEKKIDLLLALPHIQDQSPFLSRYLAENKEQKAVLVLLSLAAANQAERLLTPRHLGKNDIEALVETLHPIETLYWPIGGILGYHYHFIKLLYEKETSCQLHLGEIQRPPGYNLDEDSAFALHAIKEGVQRLHEMAEIYPVAGAADRLDLRDASSGEPLPAAALQFQGHTLLEWLIRDLQGREHLHFKLSGKRVLVPLILMTSIEKNNHKRIQTICSQLGWFSRPKESFYFITQPLVPLIGEDGQWIMKSSNQFEMKPGGHGIIWKLAENEGAFDWLKQKKKHHLLIRQINNPAAGLDSGLLALAGTGCAERRAFGFASCERIVHSSEGMDVLIEHHTPNGFEYKITNIEYTDFELRGIQDQPREKGSPYSLYPANTNILFASLRAVKKAIQTLPFPGLLINLKNAVTQISNEGDQVTMAAGRLESIMQNIADAIICTSPRKLQEEEKKKLSTFVLYNKRSKTIAATKKSLKPGKPILETPEGALYTLLSEHRELLSQCGIKTPPLRSESEYMALGPSFLMRYHPALGPLYSVITQKLKRGILREKAELILEISELRIEDIDLRGSLIIHAENPLGHLNPSGETLYSHQGGKCTLINVKIDNKGIDFSLPQSYCSSQHSRLESLEITIEGNGEFYAEGITFEGPHQLFVPKGCKMTAHQEGKEVKFSIEKISKPTWFWNYSFDQDNRIKLS